MEEASNNEPALMPVACFTMEQAQAHFKAVMAEEPKQPARRSPHFGCRKTTGQIAGEQVNKDVIAAMVAENPAFVDCKRVLPVVRVHAQRLCHPP